MPSAFRVARDSDGSPAAFQCLCEATSVPAWLLSADPMAATWRVRGAGYRFTAPP